MAKSSFHSLSAPQEDGVLICFTPFSLALKPKFTSWPFANILIRNTCITGPLTTIGIIHTATALWKASKPASQHFFCFGHHQRPSILVTPIVDNLNLCPIDQLEPASIPISTPSPFPSDCIANTFTCSDHHPPPLFGRHPAGSVSLCQLDRWPLYYL